MKETDSSLSLEAAPLRWKTLGNTYTTNLPKLFYSFLLFDGNTHPEPTQQIGLAPVAEINGPSHF